MQTFPHSLVLSLIQASVPEEFEQAKQHSNLANIRMIIKYKVDFC